MPRVIVETFIYASWEHAFSKLLIWTLTEYEKVVWLDVDTLVLKYIILFVRTNSTKTLPRNMDEVFAFPELSATRDFGGYGRCDLKRRINSGTGK